MRGAVPGKLSLFQRMCNYLSAVLPQDSICHTVAPSLPSYISHVPTLKADTGASNHFLKSVDAKYLTNLQQIVNGPTALLPNSTTITPSHSGMFR